MTRGLKLLRAVFERGGAGSDWVDRAHADRSARERMTLVLSDRSPQQERRSLVESACARIPPITNHTQLILNSHPLHTPSPFDTSANASHAHARVEHKNSLSSPLPRAQTLSAPFRVRSQRECAARR